MGGSKSSMRSSDFFLVFLVLFSIFLFIMAPISKKSGIRGVKLYEKKNNVNLETDILELEFFNERNKQVECNVSIQINKEEKITKTRI